MPRNTLQYLYKYYTILIIQYLLYNKYYIMFLKLKAKNSKFKIVMLNNDVLTLIDNLTNIKCHICNKKYKLQHDFYKKQNKFYYCSKNCYHFI